MKRSTHNYTRDTLTTLLFGLFLFLPLAGMRWPLDPSPPLTETRTLAGRPHWPKNWTQWKAFPDAVTAWFGDHYGFRNLLVAGHGFGVMSGWVRHEKIVAGRADWLFFRGNEEDWVTRDALGLIPLTDDQVEYIRGRMRARTAYLESKNLKSVRVVVPNKGTANPQAYPFSKRGRSQLDQLLGGDVPLLDLRPVLTTGADGHSYYKSRDTHWTEEGAFYGAKAILTALSMDWRSVGPVEVAEQEEVGDLITMLGLGAYPGVLSRTWVFEQPPVETPPVWRFVLADGSLAAPEELDQTPAALIRSHRPHIRKGDADGPVALIFHDSFGVALAPWLAASFSKAVFVWMMPKDNDVAWWVGFAQPDVVIECFVERHTVVPYLY